MITNQTIDGVPRELLERVRRHMLNGTASIKDLAALRALLDAPAQPSGDPAGSFDKHMQYLHENIELKKRIAELEAAQSQGEPVAWVECSPAWLKAGGDCATAPRLCVGRDGISHLHPANAEQPAPVAVMTGGRRNGKSHLAQQLESLAKQVYDSWESQPGFVPWVDGGNSTKQDEARQIASRTFELALANQVENEK